jgi:hypothetical protein
MINSIIDIIFSACIALNYYDGSTRSKILFIFLIPISSMSYFMFGESPIRYLDFIRIPALLYLVVHYYNKFTAHTKENHLDKLILILVSIVYFCLIFTMVVENQTPINALGMVSNAFTSNSYVVTGNSTVGVMISTFLGWSGYIISGIATASLAAAIVLRGVNKKFDRIENKQDDFERMMAGTPKNEMEDLKSELKSIHDENAELKREMAELKELIKNK